MQLFSNPKIKIAGPEDIPALIALLNAAYRGESSKQGWTTEADIIAGDKRTDETNLRDIMQLAGSIFLQYLNDELQIIGCVNLQQHGNKIYLGMFSVSPQLQGAGIGKEILNAADEYARHLNCSVIYMSVISVRTALISWYKRHGYEENGERKPFIEDGLTGKHLQPLEFLILQKNVDP